MMNEKILKAMNEQINAEMYSAYLYLSMSAYLESIDLTGFSNWMNVQAQEEMSHAMKFYNFILERGGEIELLSIDKPQQKWESVAEIFKASLKHEQLITSKIDAIMRLVHDERDYPSMSLMQWFVDEQVEEESNVSKILNQLKLIGDSGNGIFMIDKELSTRVFVPPAE